VEKATEKRGRGPSGFIDHLGRWPIGALAALWRNSNGLHARDLKTENSDDLVKIGSQSLKTACRRKRREKLRKQSGTVI